MPTPPKKPAGFKALVDKPATVQDKQVEQLQKQLTAERDGRREDRFVGIVLLVLLLDVVFFTLVSFGGALALLVLELLILIPLARRMGMEEIAQIISSVLHRIAQKASDHEGK